MYIILTELSAYSFVSLPQSLSRSIFMIGNMKSLARINARQSEKRFFSEGAVEWLYGTVTGGGGVQWEIKIKILWKTAWNESILYFTGGGKEGSIAERRAFYLNHIVVLFFSFFIFINNTTPVTRVYHCVCIYTPPFFFITRPFFFCSAFGL